MTGFHLRLPTLDELKYQPEEVEVRHDSFIFVAPNQHRNVKLKKREKYKILAMRFHAAGFDFHVRRVLALFAMMWERE